MSEQTPKTTPSAPQADPTGAPPEKEKGKARAKSFWLTRFRRQMEEHMFRKHNGTFVLYWVLRLIVLAILIRAFFRRDYESATLCGLVLLLFLVPSFLERKLRITFPSAMEKIILLFTFAAEILGEIREYYIRYAWWDTMLHTMNGFLCAAIGFALVDILNENPNAKFQLSPFYMAVTAFCFSMTVGVIWEFFEFGMDRLLLFDMQKDTVVHTISSVMLDPNGGNTPLVLDGIVEVTVNGQPLGGGGYRVHGFYVRRNAHKVPDRAGHRFVRHHERPVRQLHRRGGVQHDRVFLCQLPGQKPVCAAVYPGALRPGRSGRRRRAGKHAALRTKNSCRKDLTQPPIRSVIAG